MSGTGEEPIEGFPTIGQYEIVPGPGDPGYEPPLDDPAAIQQAILEALGDDDYDEADVLEDPDEDEDDDDDDDDYDDDIVGITDEDEDEENEDDVEESVEEDQPEDDEDTPYEEG